MKMKKVFCLLLIAAMVLASGILPVSADGPQTLQVLGASIRIADSEMQGLRFVGRVSEHESLAFDEEANFGFLLIPSSATFSSDISESTPNVKKVPAKVLMTQGSVEAVGLTYEPGYIYFSAVLLGIPQEFYGTEIIARAYAPEVVSTSATRSVASIANALSKSPDAPAEQKTVASELLEVYNAVGIDMLIPASSFAQLVTYPNYTGIATDSLYSVSVTQYSTTKNLTVYNQAADYTHFNKDRVGSSRALGALDSNRRFCEFAFDWGSVTVNIRVNKKFNSYVVSPTSKGFASTYSDGVISVTLEKPEYFVVILDDDYNTALSVFADLPETDVPTKGSANVVYVDTDGSITDPSNLISYSGTKNEVATITKNNAKVYIAPGAVLKKRLVFTQKWDGQTRVEGQNANGVKVFGRGMILDPYSDIANSDMVNRPTTTDYDKNSKNVFGTVMFFGFNGLIEDVKVIDSRNFNIVFSQSFCSANHVKVLSTEMSTDGFTATGKTGTTSGGIVENSFVYVGDNALVVGNPEGKTGYTFRNITVGTTCAAIYPQTNANATFEDIYVFRADDGLINVFEDGVGSQTVNVNGLDALDCVKTPALFKTNGDEGTATKTFNLKNVVMRNTTGDSYSFTPGAAPEEKMAIYNANDNSSGYVLNFTNLYVGGNYVSGNNQTGAVLKVNSSGYAGTNPGYNVTCSFAKDESDPPAHTLVPASKTANYTGGASYVAGPVDTLMWTRYQSYKCAATYSNGVYTVVKTTDTNTSDWGFSVNLTEFAKENGTGTYNVTFRPNARVRYSVVKTPNNSGVTSCLLDDILATSGTSRTVSVNITDVANYTWYVIVRAESNTLTSFTLTNTNVIKKA